MKKLLVLILAATLLLAGCGGGKSEATAPPAAPEAASRPQPQSAAPTSLTVTFSNASSYIFNEIYITPTASNHWGDDLLGSTQILKNNGSINVEVEAYDFENYDILVVDEEGDEYHFTRVPLQNGGEVAIYFGDEGLAADLYDAAGNATATVSGTLEGGASSTGGATPQQAGALDWIEFNLSNGTSHIVFTEVYFMPEGTTEEAGMGYNHIASIAPMLSGDSTTIGVEDYIYFDILFVDSNGDGWHYTEVYLEEGCAVYPTNANGAGLIVEHTDGSYAEYHGDILY